MKYVCGFAFDASLSKVVLIEKISPAWQAGRLNGVGGKIESGETPLQAMNREFAEETGVTGLAWHHAVHLDGFSPADPDSRSIDQWIYSVDFFFAHKIDLNKVYTMTDEQVMEVKIADVFTDNTIIPNLVWLIPLCLDTNIEKPVYVKNVAGY